MPDEFEFAGRVTRILIAVHATRNGCEVSAFGGSPYATSSNAGGHLNNLRVPNPSPCAYLESLLSWQALEKGLEFFSCPFGFLDTSLSTVFGVAGQRLLIQNPLGYNQCCDVRSSFKHEL